MTTHAADDGPGPGAPGRAPRGVPAPGPRRRRIEQRRPLPGSRAVAGGLLVAVAGLGTLVTWQQASGTPDHAYAVAGRPIAPGERLAAEDVRLEPIDLPADLAGRALADTAALRGRVALAPIGEGELLQLGQLSEPGAERAAAEVSFALPRDRVVDGRLRAGEWVDVFVTHDLGTDAVAEGVQVVAVSEGGTTFTRSGEITVTVALTVPDRRAQLIQAVRTGEVTLVRSTHTAPAAGSPSTASGSRPSPTFPPGDEPAPDASGAAPADGREETGDRGDGDTGERASEGGSDGGSDGDTSGAGAGSDGGDTGDTGDTGDAPPTTTGPGDDGAESTDGPGDAGSAG